MIDWWNALDLTSQIFAAVAMPTTLLLLVQTVLMLIGIGAEGGADDIPLDGLATELEAGDGVFGTGRADADIEVDAAGFDALRILTVRGIIAFFVVFGWVGFVMNNAGIELWITVPVALASGLATMLLLAYLMRAVMRLREQGNIDNRNALGVSGRVYLTVPATRAGEGKVNLLIQGSYVERDAVTDEGDAIPTGAEVVVVGLSGETTLVVKRK